MSLQESSTLKLKSPRIEAKEAPGIGDIAQLKKDLPRGSWKLSHIVELIKSAMETSGQQKFYYQWKM